MSVSELLDHGQPHPWSILREQQLTIDGNLFSSNIGNQPIQPNPITLAVGFLPTPLYFKGSGTTTTIQPTTPVINILTLNYKVGTNSATYVLLTTQGFVKSGTFINVGPVQLSEYKITVIGGVITNTLEANRAFIVPIAPGTVGLAITTGVNTVSFQVYDNNANDVVTWIWSVEVYSVNNV